MTSKIPAAAWAVIALSVGAAKIALAETETETVMQRAQELFQVLNDGHHGDYRGFVASRVSPRLRDKFGDESLNEILQELAAALGPTEGRRPVRGIEANDDGSFGIGLRNAEGDPARLVLYLADDPARPFDGFGLMFDELPPPPGLESLAEAGPLIDEFVSERAADDRFSGVVVVARDGRPLFSRAWGLADRATGRALTPDTPLNLGSMNKMFTGLAIAQLQEAGKLDWDDAVGEHLPDFPDARIRDEVTIAQLLTHTSGVPSYWNDVYSDRKDEIDSLDAFLATFIDEPLLFEPGTGHQYSNGGPVILGLIIERLSGQDYYAYVREHIYAPAGMRHSGHFRKTDAQAGIAIGYHREDPETELAPNTDWLGLRGSPAGGGYASASDLARFSQALSSGALLPADSLETLWTPRSEMGPDFGYGYLWGTGQVAGQRWVGHNGGAPGVSADFRHYPDAGVAVIVLANISGAAMPVSRWVNALVAANLDQE